MILQFVWHTFVHTHTFDLHLRIRIKYRGRHLLIIKNHLFTGEIIIKKK